MQQPQAAQLDFREENGVAKIVGFDLRRLAFDSFPVGTKDLLPGWRGGLGQQFVDLALVENITELVVRIVCLEESVAASLDDEV